MQLDEPGLVSESLGVPAERVHDAVRRAYTALATDLARPDRPALLVAAPLGDLGAALPTLAGDRRRGTGTRPRPRRPPGGTGHRTGRADGRRRGRRRPQRLADRPRGRAAPADGAASRRSVRTSRSTAGTSTSLLHVPHDVDDEPDLDPTLRSWLAFADQKVREVATLADALVHGPEAAADAVACRRRSRSPDALRPTASSSRRSATGWPALGPDALRRTPYDDRRATQDARLSLPPLPTTTIGSFPQTTEIRTARAAHTRGELDDAGYTEAMRAEIRHVVALQEDIGLDVLVHGEAERNDMVQYFAEHLTGFASTANAWVQSYGSRCVRPPILWGDVTPARADHRGVDHVRRRRSPTSPSRACSPARSRSSPGRSSATTSRSPTPRGRSRWRCGTRSPTSRPAGSASCRWTSRHCASCCRCAPPTTPPTWRGRSSAFRLATSGVRDETQVHTHLCYSEFGQVIGAIDAPGRRRHEHRGGALADGGPRRPRGGRATAAASAPGCTTSTRPRVPSASRRSPSCSSAAVRSVDPALLWVNPDCGLKTRRYDEVEPALRHLVAAARAVRAGRAGPPTCSRAASTPTAPGTPTPACDRPRRRGRRRRAKPSAAGTSGRQLRLLGGARRSAADGLRR